MLSVSDLSKDEVVFICQKIGYDEITDFLQKNKMLPEKPSYIGKRKGREPYPSVFWFMFAQSRLNPLVIDFLNEKILGMIRKCESALIRDLNDIPLTLSILNQRLNRSEFGDNKELFFKIVEVQDLSEYLDLLKVKYQITNKKQNNYEVSSDDSIKISQIQDEVIELKAENRELKKTIKNQSDNINRLSLKLEKAKYNIKDISKNFERKEKSYKSELNKREEEIQKIKSEKKNQDEEYQQIIKNIQELKRSKEIADTELKNFKEEITRLQSENQQLLNRCKNQFDMEKSILDLKTDIEIKSKKKTELLSEITLLETKISDLSQEAIDWENEIKQLKLKHTQISAQVNSEINSFSDNLVNSAIFTALMNKVSDRNKNSESEKIYIEIPETDKLNAEKVTDVNEITDILSYNLHMTGIIKNSNEWAKVFLSAIYSNGNIIIYGNNLSETADAVSLSVFAEYPAHVVLPLNTGDIPYYINMINNIDRKVIFIDNCFDALSDKLCISLTKYCKSKILIFGLNDINSLKCISKLNVFSNTVYINLNNIQSYPVKREYKIAYWDILKKDCNTELIEKIYNKTLFQNIIKDFDIPFSFARFLTEIKYNYSELYKIHERKIIVSELMLYFMINDMISSEEAKNFIKLLKENDDDKIELIETLLGEVE